MYMCVDCVSRVSVSSVLLDVEILRKDDKASQVKCRQRWSVLAFFGLVGENPSMEDLSGSSLLTRGGGGTGGSQSPASRTFLSLGLPLLCFSRYHVNHAVWLPIQILIGSALALSKIKNFVVNRTTPHFPARSLKRHSFDTSLLHAAKSSSQCFVNPQEGLPWTDFSPPNQKNTKTDQNGLWQNLTWLAVCRPYGEFLQLARQTRHWHDWHSRRTCTYVMLSHSCPMM